MGNVRLAWVWTLCLLTVVSLLGLAPKVAATGLIDTSVTVPVWHDRPGELLTLINKQLPPHQRFAWYADPQLDTVVDRGPIMPARAQSIGALLDAYCAATNLAWLAHGRHIWLFQASADDDMQRWRAGLTAYDDPQLSAALIATVSQQNPQTLALLLEHQQVKPAIYGALVRFLGGSSNALGQAKLRAFELLGHPDVSQRSFAVIGAYDNEKPAPWVAAYIVSNHSDYRALIADTVTQQASQVSGRIPLLLFAVSQQSAVGTAALAAWIKGDKIPGHKWMEGNGWESRYMRGRVQEVQAWMQSNAAADKDIQDYAAINAHFAAIFADDNSAVQKEYEARLQPLRAKEQQLKKQSKKDSSKRAAFEQVKKERQPLERYLKALRGDLKARLQELQLFQSYGADAQGQIRSLLNDTTVDALLRQRAAEFFLSQGQLYEIESLIAMCRTDDDPVVRRMLALALAASRQPVAIAALQQDIANTSSAIGQMNAVRALVSQNEPGVGALIVQTAQATERDDLRQALIQFLGLCRDPETAAYLLN